jgi:type I restriction enzyme R subunit
LSADYCANSEHEAYGQRRYLDLYSFYRPRQAADKEDINDDLVFEIELVKQVAVDLPAILDLVGKYHDDNCRDKEIPVAINKAVDANPALRSKKDLIDAFLLTLAPGADVGQAWIAYLQAAKAKELDAIITEENLIPEETCTFMANAFRDGAVPTTGTAVTKILPPTSRFTPSSLHGNNKNRVLARLQDFFERYSQE